jgi:hypothetical protein
MCNFLEAVPSLKRGAALTCCSAAGLRPSGVGGHDVVAAPTGSSSRAIQDQVRGALGHRHCRSIGIARRQSRHD